MSSPISDQIAADREVVDGAAIIFGIDDRCRLGGKTRQILIDRQSADVDVARQKGLQRHRRRELVGTDRSAGQLENALMDRLEEMLRLEEIGDAVKRLVIDEDRPEQCLLGLDIVRRGTERRFRRRLLACGRIEYRHGPIKRIVSCGRFAAYGRNTAGEKFGLLLNIVDHSTTAAHCAHSRPLRNHDFVDSRAAAQWEILIAAVPTTHRGLWDEVQSALDATPRLRAMARSLAGKSQRCGIAGLEPRKRASSRVDVIAGLLA